MDIEAAKSVLLSTHVAALKHEMRANGMHLESGPGIGKTDATFQYAAELAAESKEPVGVVIFMLATISSVDVRGFMLPTKSPTGSLDTIFSTPPWFPTQANTWVVEADGKTWHKPGTLFDERLDDRKQPTQVPRSPPRIGVLFLDEFSQAEDDVKKPAAELVYKGNVGTCELPGGWRVVSAGNRMSDRSGVLRDLMFLVNRRCCLGIDPSLPAWLNWANAQPPNRRPHYLTKSFAQKNPDIVFKDRVPDGSDPFCTPRTLCLLDRDLAALRTTDDIAKDRLPTHSTAREVAAGWIGGAAAAQFFTHLKYADELPDVEDIEREPSKAKLPATLDAQMVCGYMLAHNVNEKNAAAMIRYMRRMHIEMQVLAVRAISAQKEHAKAVVAQPEYVEWLMANKELIVASRS